VFNIERRQNMQSLRIPTDAEFQELANDFKLSKRRARFLEMVVKETLADIRSFQRVFAHQPNRDERRVEVRDRGDFAALVSKLISFLEARPKFLRKILRNEVLEELGDSFSFTGIGRSLERDVFPMDGMSLRSHFRRNRIPIDIASVEAFYARRREDYGLLHGEKLLLYVLRLADVENKNWLVANAANRGGRPANFERREVIATLIEAAPDILGYEPPMSIGSEFIEFCERVLTLCGFDEKGIDKAVLEALRAARSKSSSRAEPNPSPA
jgi:hypothetical protein